MRTLLVLTLAASLAGCATTGSPQHTASEGRLIAWGALDGVSLSLDSLAKSGVLHGPAAAKASADLQTATATLQAADTAAAQLDFSSVAADVATATALITSLQVIVAQSKGH